MNKRMQEQETMEEKLDSTAPENTDEEDNGAEETARSGRTHARSRPTVRHYSYSSTSKVLTQGWPSPRKPFDRILSRRAFEETEPRDRRRVRINQEGEPPPSDPYP